MCDNSCNAMSLKVLITGGSGLIGQRLSAKLAVLGHEVVHLSRNKDKSSNYKTFTWDISEGVIEQGALDGVDVIIHLAGAGVADKRWTDERKRLLTSSRIDSANLLFEQVKSRNHKISAFISASAIGIYGFDTGGILQTEERIQLGDDFLATLTKKWELAADKFNDVGARVVKLRIGLVLSERGGLLGRMVPFAKLGLSSGFGSGEQFMSWIHIDDLAGMFIMALENQKLQGVYNAVAPDPVTNNEFLKILAGILNKPHFLPNTPKFLLKLGFGELASVITGGNNVSSKKIEKVGFKFDYEKLDKALVDLLRV